MRGESAVIEIFRVDVGRSVGGSGNVKAAMVDVWISFVVGTGGEEQIY